MSLKFKSNGVAPGWGEKVHPLIRVLAACIGLVGILSIALSAFLIYFGRRDLQVNLENIFDFVAFPLMAFYGTSIAISGRAPGKHRKKENQN